MREEEGETRLVHRATVRIQPNRPVKAQVIIRCRRYALLTSKSAGAGTSAGAGAGAVRG